MRKVSGVIEQAGLLAAVEQAADGIVITNADGTIQYVNRAFIGMTGYSSEEAVGTYWHILEIGYLPVEVLRTFGRPCVPG